MAYESPLPVDEPMAPYRVHCPTCRRNIWAGLEEPPAQGDDIIAAHDCPGPADVAAESGLEPEPTPQRVLRARTAASEVADEITSEVPNRPSVSGHPVDPAPPVA